MIKTIPPRENFYNPILKAIKQLGRRSSIKEIEAKVAKLMRLPDEVLQIPHKARKGNETKLGKGNKTEVEYRMDWGRTNLKKYGLLDNPSRGIWSLTRQGESVHEVDAQEVTRVASKRRIKALLPRNETPRDQTSGWNRNTHFKGSASRISRPLPPDPKEIWADLEKKSSSLKKSGTGIREVKAFPDVPDLLFGLDAKGRQMLFLKCMLKERQGGELEDGTFFRAWKDSMSDWGDGLQRIVLQRKTDDDPEYDFASLVTKVIKELSHVSAIGSSAFIDAIEKAVEMFRAKKAGALDDRQQMGLIAELWLLKNVLMKYLPPEKAIAAWHGQKHGQGESEKDFWLPGCLIEIKATGRNSSSVTISSIAQLDTDAITDDLRPLFLFSLCLAKDQENGKTLSDYVDEIINDLTKRKDLRDKSKCLKEFMERLIGAPPTDGGFKRYREDHREKYKTKYSAYGDAQRGTFYRVNGVFPRIRPADLKRMKVKVKTYTIDLDDCGNPIDEKDIIRPFLVKI